MARQLVPIKVKITLKGEEEGRNAGYAKYPAFNNIASSIRKGLDWSIYVDKYGAGWHYDKCCGHEKNTVESPAGQQWGVLLVPQDFADAAVAQFPDEVTKITEVELQPFYDDHVASNQPHEKVDINVLQHLFFKEQRGEVLNASDNLALNPNDNKAPGIIKNPRKKWTDYKNMLGIEIVA